ncbi:MAG: hypothetical protein Q4D58_03235 [Synergistaceae bacterium]|nr:hypothetical protein [Synergistaceae bacterium]
MKKIILLIFCAAFAALPAIACTDCSAAGKKAENEGEARGEALALIRVAENIRAAEGAKERNELFAALCREIAEKAGAEIVYISPVYDDSESGVAHFKSRLATEEIIKRLKEEPRVIGASPNRLTKLSQPAK